MKRESKVLLQQPSVDPISLELSPSEQRFVRIGELQGAHRSLVAQLQQIDAELVQLFGAINTERARDVKDERMPGDVE